MAYTSSTFFLLAPAPSGESTYNSIKQLYPSGLQSLAYANPHHNSGIDLPTPQDITVPYKPGKSFTIDLQIRAVHLHLIKPPGVDVSSATSTWPYYLCSRSSISDTPLIMANPPGIIDQEYNGSLKAKVHNTGDKPFTIQAGHSLFQIVAPNLVATEYEVLSETDPRIKEYFSDDPTKRGTGCFGSTGAAGSASAAD